MTSKQLGVKFRVMTEEERESYLGDLIRHGVTEEERFGGILANIEKTGEKWNRERIGIYGRAIVANTLLLSKISHRAQQYERPSAEEPQGEVQSVHVERSRKGNGEMGDMMGEEEGGVGLRESPGEDQNAR